MVEYFWKAHLGSQGTISSELVLNITPHGDNEVVDIHDLELILRAMDYEIMPIMRCL